MTRSLLLMALKERVAVPLLGIAVAILWTLLPEFQSENAGLVRAMNGVLGMFLATLLGSDLPQGGPGGWPFQLARPVPRRRLAGIRTLTDLISLGLLAIAFIFASGAEARAWYLARGEVVLLLFSCWIVCYALSAGLAAFGLPTLGVVTGTVMVLGLLVTGSILLVGHLTEMPSLMLLFIVGVVMREQGALVIPDVLVLMQVCFAVALPVLAGAGWGWVTALAAIDRGPVPLARGRLAGAALLGILLSYGGVAWAVLQEDTGMLNALQTEVFGARLTHEQQTLERRSLGLTQDGARLEFQQRPLRQGKLVRIEKNGERHRLATFPDSVTLYDGGPAGTGWVFLGTPEMAPSLFQLYVYEPGSTRVLAHDLETASPLRVFQISPDGQQLLYDWEGSELRIMPVRDPGASRLIAKIQDIQKVGYDAKWTRKGKIELFVGSQWQTFSADTFRLEQTRALSVPRPVEALQEVTEIHGGHLLVSSRAYQPGMNMLTLIRADGTQYDLSSLEGHPTLLLQGLQPWTLRHQGLPALLLRSQLEPDKVAVWRIGSDGQVTRLGTLSGETQALDLVLEAGGARGFAKIVREVNREVSWILCELREGKIIPLPQQALVGGFWLDSQDDSGIVVRDGHDTLHRIPWPAQAAFASD